MSMIHICFLEADKIDKSEFSNKPVRKVLSESLDVLGLDKERATKICEELNNHKTIAAWLTEGSKA